MWGFPPIGGTHYTLFSPPFSDRFFPFYLVKLEFWVDVSRPWDTLSLDKILTALSV